MPHAVSLADVRRAVGRRCESRAVAALAAVADHLCQRIASEAAAAARSRRGPGDERRPRVRAEDVEAVLLRLGLTGRGPDQSGPQK